MAWRSKETSRHQKIRKASRKAISRNQPLILAVVIHRNSLILKTLERK